jgi:hypothetical protein
MTVRTLVAISFTLIVVLFLVLSSFRIAAPRAEASGEDAARITNEEVTYIPSLWRGVAIVRGNIEIVGHLDSTGRFIEDVAADTYDLQKTAMIICSPIVINWARVTEVEYEYRSGRLVKGHMDVRGNFAPEVGAKVTSFKDYRPGKDPVIWNLPGRFKEKKDEPADGGDNRPTPKGE